MSRTRPRTGDCRNYKKKAHIVEGGYTNTTKFSKNTKRRHIFRKTFCAPFFFCTTPPFFECRARGPKSFCFWHNIFFFKYVSASHPLHPPILLSLSLSPLSLRRHRGRDTPEKKSSSALLFSLDLNFSPILRNGQRAPNRTLHHTGLITLCLQCSFHSSG